MGYARPKCLRLDSRMPFPIIEPMKEVKSRERFVKEVVESIASGDGSEDAFIFGISGRWGEGKSHFLDKLKIELEKRDKPKLKVVDLNPWKYAHDDDSILRELLRQLVKLHGRGLRRYWLERELRSLYHDTSKSRINYGMTAVAALSLLASWLLYKWNDAPIGLITDYQEFVQNNKTLVTILLLPILLGVAGAITTSQTSSKAVQTRDRFDRLMKDILKDLDVDKVVVYVDDLDRLTAEKALLVLDNLRTFFDKSKLIFVVASDHSVLERHLGLELNPHASPAEQLEEGRRFLKKIFNVYWRLPLPTKPEFAEYIKELTGKDNNPLIHQVLRNPSNRKRFRGYLETHFSNNFRNTERFVSRVEFTFKLIEAQHKAKSTSKRDKEYFGEMLENPLLVVRILLIEELANPLYDKIQQQPDLLLRLEQDFTVGASSNPPEYEILSPQQRAFAESFMGEKPRFRDESGVRVKSVEPYIFLSSDSSFGDIRGLSPEEFVKRIERGAAADLVKILATSSEQTIRESMQKLSDAFVKDADAATKAQMLGTLLDVAKQSDEKLEAKRIITESIVSYDLSFLDEEPIKPEQKMVILEDIGLLNLDETQFSVVLENAPPFRKEEWATITTLDSGEPIAELTQNLFLRYFTEYFKTNPGDAISQLGPRIDAFNDQVVNKCISSHLEPIVSYFVSDRNDTRRRYFLELLSKTDEGSDKLKGALKTQLAAGDGALLNWLMDLAKSSTDPLFDSDEIVEAVFPTDSPAENPARLTDKLTLFQGHPEPRNKIWDVILQIDSSLLLPALFDAALVNNYAPLSPSSEDANILLQKIIREYITKDTIDKPEATNWLGRITRDKWLFTNLQLDNKTQQLIGAKLGTQYLNDDHRAQFDRIKDDFKS
jgi:hypothetical protein